MKYLFILYLFISFTPYSCLGQKSVDSVIVGKSMNELRAKFILSESGKINSLTKTDSLPSFFERYTYDLEIGYVSASSCFTF